VFHGGLWQSGAGPADSVTRVYQLENIYFCYLCFFWGGGRGGARRTVKGYTHYLYVRHPRCVIYN